MNNLNFMKNLEAKMSYILPSGRAVTSEVLLKLEEDGMPGLPIACKVCPAAMWQLTGKPESPQARCFCRVMHAFTWSGQQQEEILDCDLIYMSEEQAEQKRIEKEQKQEEKDERERRRERENLEKQQRAVEREQQRQRREEKEELKKLERDEKERSRQEQKAREALEKAERARTREEKKQQKSTSKPAVQTSTELPSVDSPMMPEVAKHSDLPAFQSWADQTPPLPSEGDYLEQETDN
ncbi:hypothetical protein BL250_12485 [Erwinia sp. OLTSP20]|nr:hypothetical protein BMF91_23940 [Serratia sp. OLFL2]PIJ69751.1 hypothetical protein BK416_13855 [Erwinia sp. OLSSP12]PIJ76235.1 hypothetical protein BLD47_18110 [Erwinia sp. OLCASP19]PIJ76756.1 hypothetical protein BLD46_18335 [Erwinia sp. OLMTSP26]PIJ78972.1 hypothetical protein BLD49_17840 [Erwinia sp. OLMDSP33]PIJ89361.1 hypothetical protein BL249_16600 [Erwinia sp. OLFS4]PIJ91358.1 hypothetical protein BL250_12485 [Erwinia sp. OLTSP20]